MRIEYATQRLSYRFFALMLALFVVQVAFGLIIAAQRVDPSLLAGTLNFNVARSEHTNLGILWILCGFVGTILFVGPLLSKRELASPWLVKTLFWALAAVVAWNVFTLALSQRGIAGWWAGQPWLQEGLEYIDAGRGADIVIVGGSIIKAADVTKATRDVRDAIDHPAEGTTVKTSLDDTIRGLLEQVSAPNVTDALYRKGAMSGLSVQHVPKKMIGKAVTVQTFGGDWSKPVQAIDECRPGDVLVISNDKRTDIAPWGELATRSAGNKGVAGIIIDGAVRDWDDIITLDMPVYATAIQPNAGEPKGFGEINAEISCCGQTVRPGDWLIGDQSGVVVIPRERAYEVARRAVEVQKTEVRIREEIRRGGTLGSLSQLLRWEKK